MKNCNKRKGGGNGELKEESGEGGRERRKMKKGFRKEENKT
jgi:hypothetical protein